MESPSLPTVGFDARLKDMLCVGWENSCSACELSFFTKSQCRGSTSKVMRGNWGGGKRARIDDGVRTNT